MKKPQRSTAKFALHRQIMADECLPASAKCVASVLLLTYQNNKTGRCNPSYETIAKAVGLKRRATIDAVSALVKHKWLRIEGTRGGSDRHTNQYVFTPPPVQRTAPVPVQQTAPVQQNVEGVQQTAHEPLRNHSLFQRESVGGVPALRAPDGAQGLEESFERLCSIWRKPHGIDRNKAFKAFAAVCAEHDGEDVLASASRWVAVTQPRYLKKLEDWLNLGAWQNEPVQRSDNQKPSAAQVAAKLARERGEAW